jgi:hypothetical protein
MSNDMINGDGMHLDDVTNAEPSTEASAPAVTPTPQHPSSEASTVRTQPLSHAHAYVLISRCSVRCPKAHVFVQTNERVLLNTCGAPVGLQVALCRGWCPGGRTSLGESPHYEKLITTFLWKANLTRAVSWGADLVRRVSALRTTHHDIPLESERDQGIRLAYGRTYVRTLETHCKANRTMPTRTAAAAYVRGTPPGIRTHAGRARHLTPTWRA